LTSGYTATVALKVKPFSSILSSTISISGVAVTVEVGAEEFEAAVAKAYAKARGKLSIPGFRPGKAPRFLFPPFNIR